MARSELSRALVGRKLVRLDHSSHATVEDDDALTTGGQLMTSDDLEKRVERRGVGLATELPYINIICNTLPSHRFPHFAMIPESIVS